jgi:nitrogen fixation protein NifZ
MIGHSDIVEIEGRPRFVPNQKVRATATVRNDGTFPGAATGETILSAGEVGYVRDVGTFLQRYYIYAVDFVALGRVIGMRAHELEALEDADACDGPQDR